jgi:hypothetical protein
MANEWTVDDRSAARAFLQRIEVRLSTLHRVATALLSGAGLMVLLPAMARDSIVSVLRALLTSNITAAHMAILVGTVSMMALPGVTLWMFLGDLTRLYFHANMYTTATVTYSRHDSR